jgi:hypothetical protein
MKRATVVVLLLATVLACSSESEPGESCDRPGGTIDVCESGTVCGRPTEKSNVLVCIFACIDDKDCPPGTDCKGVDGTSIKGCRGKD